MQTIKAFTNLGWHTVPLKGKLERTEDGKKTVPRFEQGWKTKYALEQNTVSAQLGGTITGEISGIIAIDCDNENTYRMFKAMDPTYQAVFISKGKGYPAGTMIYSYDADLPDTFSLADNSIALDVYSNDGFVYLPTAANKTKEAWTQMHDIKPMPEIVKLLLLQLHALKFKAAAVEATPVIDANNVMPCLQPLVASFVAEKEFVPGLFRIITPKAFRDEEEYIKKGYLHPDSIPDGRGSEYLSSVSAILGADKSINTELYVGAMHAINDLWATPMDPDRLDATVCDPMVGGKASIDGKTIWQYDPEWKRNKLVLHTKRETSLELGFDDNRDLYYCVDVANQGVKQFGRDTELQSYIEAATYNPPKKADVKKRLPIINVLADPSRPFGFHGEGSVRDMNTFKQTPELAILRDPERYEQYYKTPESTLRYLESLVPEDHMRQYLLGFLKRKLTTFTYSPVILYFLGVQGSGKDTLVAILEQILGHVARPKVKQFLELNNSWLLDSYVVQLDEFGNQLTKLSDKEEVLGLIKAYSGKNKVDIRKMRTDSFSYVHSATFIMTANKQPLMLEDGDRRIAFFPTPNKLEAQSWVRDISDTYNQIMSEVPDFCYYLATQVTEVTPAEYVSPPESEAKLAMIADSMFAAQRIAFVLKNRMMDYLTNLAHEYEVPSLLKGIKSGRVTSDMLEELYDMMTDMKGEMRTLTKTIRNSGVEIVPTTNGGVKSHYYKIFEEQENGSPFEEISGN